MVENNLDYIIFDNQKIYLESGKLNLNLKRISEIEQIENFDRLTYLTELDFQHNKLSVLKSFGNHPYLKKLQLNDNKIEKVEDLEGLENLEELDLSNNKLSEINGLEKLVNLRKLDIYNNEIIEIKGLDNLINLEELILSKNNIEEIKGLDKLRNLKILVLSDNKISKIKGLENLNNLKELYLGKNIIEEIEGLNKLINIETLDLRSNNINKISGLNNLKKLRYLKFADNKEIYGLINKFGGFGTNFVNHPYNYVKYCRNEYVIFQNEFFFLEERPENLIGFQYNKNVLTLQGLGIRDINEIKGLENLPHLEGLLLDHNQISAIKGLEKLENLKMLWLSNNKIKNIEGLEKLQQLQELILSQNEIQEIEGLENLINLEVLDHRKNNIKEIRNLDKLEKLKELTLRNNQIEEIKGLDRLVNLESLTLKDNKIREIENLDNLEKLKKLSLVSNKITEIKNLENLKNLETLALSDNKQINKLKGLDNLKTLRELFISDTNISKIEDLESLENLETLFLKSNKIDKIEGLETLINLSFIDLENNNINSTLLNSLKVDNKAFSLISYCILKPIIEELEDKIMWSSLVEKFPYLDKLHFTHLNKFIKEIRDVEILRENGNILSVVTREYLATELDKLLIPRKENEELEYEIISQELKIKNLDRTKRLVNYIIENELSDFFLYKSQNGINKASTEQLQHQLAIFDAPNQTPFFKQNLYEPRINELERFLVSRQKHEMIVFKIAFVNDGVYKGGNSAGINFLENNARWNLLSISKEKKEDVDALIESFVVQIDKIYSRKWDSIYVLSSDLRIVNFFLMNYEDSSSTSIFFITDQSDHNLDSNNALKRYEQSEFEINIYYRINQKEKLD